MVQEIFDDIDSKTSHSFAYFDTKKWDAERNNREFIEAMPLWKSYGLNCYLDFRFPGETDYAEGYQRVPVDWGIKHSFI